MGNQFDPFNPIIRLCLSGMSAEEQGNLSEALTIFIQAWNESKEDLEKFLSAFYIARVQKEITSEIEWLKTALSYALKIDDVSGVSALPAVYRRLSGCYEKLSESDRKKKYEDLAAAIQRYPLDEGPFFHGTKADLTFGDLLVPGGESNYQAGLMMNHIYFSANIKGAGLAAAMAKGNGSERVYVIEPLGAFEDDPNVTDKKFPGNMTRSYRSLEPLKIVGEVKEWRTASPEELLQWRKKLKDHRGEIIN